MYAPPKDCGIPVLEYATALQQYDGILFGVPTRFGNFPAERKTFWDNTGRQWQSRAS
jgi:NAD(P)H dehydrogenase (quinone)